MQPATRDFVSYEAVAPKRTRARPNRAARALAASAMIILGVGALAAAVARGWGPRNSGTVVIMENAATKESDFIEGFPAGAFMGGALTMEQFPPQCERGGSGDFRCAGLAHDCAQCLDGRHNFSKVLSTVVLSNRPGR